MITVVTEAAIGLAGPNGPSSSSHPSASRLSRSSRLDPRCSRLRRWTVTECNDSDRLLRVPPPGLRLALHCYRPRSVTVQTRGQSQLADCQTAGPPPGRHWQADPTWTQQLLSALTQDP
jgi:hypothetical protein